jgi:F0F1-type ATP synthase assembly protein I
VTEPRKSTRESGAIGRYGTIGLEICIAVLLGFFVGNYLDSHFQTTPWLTLFGLFSGVGAAIRALVRMVRMYQEEMRGQ